MSDRGNEAVTNAQQEAAAQGRAQGLERDGLGRAPVIL